MQESHRGMGWERGRDYTCCLYNMYEFCQPWLRSLRYERARTTGRCGEDIAARYRLLRGARSNTGSRKPGTRVIVSKEACTSVSLRLRIVECHGAVRVGFDRQGAEDTNRGLSVQRLCLGLRLEQWYWRRT